MAEYIQDFGTNVIKRLDEIEGNLLRRANGIEKTNGIELDIIKTQRQQLYKVNQHFIEDSIKDNNVM